MPTSRAEPAEAASALREELARNYPKAAVTAIDAALSWLEAEGTPALDRGLARANTLARLRLDPSTVALGLVAPHAKPVPDELLALIAGDAKEVVEAVDRLAGISWTQVAGEKLEDLRRMLVAIAQDVRVIFILLVDRLETMRHLDQADPERRDAMASETLELFAPLANRLGVWQLKWELEDRCLRQLEPGIYQQLRRLLADTRKRRELYVSEVIATLEAQLREHDIVGDFKIYGRPKHIYSIYKKMQRKQVSFEEVYDVIAVRIIATDLKACYAALGIVHGLWTPIAGEFDDYIARPKENMYQSLHTAVVGPEGKPVEIQIRTQQMHDFAEYGVAAHWAYKEGRRAKVADKFNGLRQLLDWHKDIADPKELAEALKTDLFGDQVYVFTPKGEVVTLPAGATSLDFAYRVHTMVGHRCRGALVNGHMVTLTHALKTGDRVEVLLRKRAEPSRDWLSPHLGYLRSGSARQKVRHWFRQQGREQAIEAGRDALERELQRRGFSGGSGELPSLDGLAQERDYKTGDDLLAALGFGDLGVHKIAERLRETYAPEPEPEPESVVHQGSPGKGVTGDGSRGAKGVSIDGVGDILSQPARCCQPVPGDDVVGYITRGRGMMLHRRDCSNVKGLEPERLLEIDWGQQRTTRYPAELELELRDRPGAFRDVVQVISQLGLNMRDIDVRPIEAGIHRARLTVEVPDNEHLSRILSRLERMSCVLSARRIER